MVQTLMDTYTLNTSDLRKGNTYIPHHTYSSKGYRNERGHES